MDGDAWEAFIRMRRKLRRPIDDASEPDVSRRAQVRHIARWAALRDAGHDANECIWAACEERWLMFYPPKTTPIERAAGDTSDDRIEAERRAAAAEKARCDAYIVRTTGNKLRRVA